MSSEGYHSQQALGWFDGTLARRAQAYAGAPTLLPQEVAEVYSTFNTAYMYQK
jgi:hypothetical protein